MAPMFLGGCGVEIVDAGNTGVKKVLGELQEDVYAPGMYFVNPFTTTIISMDNKIQRFDGETMAYTKDVQQASIQYVVNFALEPKYSAVILNTVGYYYQDVVLPQAVKGSMKNVIGQWNAIDLVANRQKATDQIEISIANSLKQYGLTVHSIELVDLSYAKQFEDAVEAKVTAVQRAEEAKNNTVKVQEEANQRIIAAEADAEAMKIKTAALKESQSLVLYELSQRWDGHLPKIMSVGDQGGNLLQVPAEVLK